MPRWAECSPVGVVFFFAVGVLIDSSIMVAQVPEPGGFVNQDNERAECCPAAVVGVICVLRAEWPEQVAVGSSVAVLFVAASRKTQKAETSLRAARL